MDGALDNLKRLESLLDCNGTSFERITLATEEFKKVCRACLRETTANNLDNYILPNNDTNMPLVTIREILEISSGVKIDVLDCLPNHICNDCLKEIKMIYRFRLQSGQIDEALKSILVKAGEGGDTFAPVAEEKVDDQYQVAYLNETYDQTHTVEAEPEIAEPEQCTPSGKKKLFRCGICLREYTFRNGLHDHIRSAHVQNKEKHCQDCGRMFRTTTRLLLHKQRNCGKPTHATHVAKEPWQAVVIVKEDLIEIKNFQCAICEEIIEFEKDFQVHLQTHWNVKNCRYCEKKISRPTHLESHVRSHIRLKPYACPFCFKAFTSTQTLRSHLKTFRERETQTCKRCDSVFCSMREYLKHYNAHVLNGDLADADEENMAKEHDSYSLDGSTSKDTESNHSNEAAADSFPQQEQLDPEVAVKQEKDEDIITIKGEKTDDDHSKFVIMNEPVSDDEQEQGNELFSKTEFKSEPEFINEHPDMLPGYEDEQGLVVGGAGQVVDVPNFQIIAVDDEAFKRREDSQLARMEAMDESFIYGIFTCPDASCSMEFKHHREVINHYTIHHCSSSPFMCTICQLRFMMEDDIRSHLKKHIKCEYRCTYCPKNYWALRDLKNHLRTHTGERPFKCSMCPQRFKQRPALRVHIQTHSITKEYKCKFCNKEFFSYNGMFLHQKSHMENKELQCKGCGKQFPTQSRLKRHLTGVCGLTIPALVANEKTKLEEKLS